MPGHTPGTPAALLCEGKGIGLVPIERKMRGIGSNHGQEGGLVGILETQFQSEPVSQRQPVVSDISRVDCCILIFLPSLYNVTPV
jgi:hypothetical protein